MAEPTKAEIQQQLEEAQKELAKLRGQISGIQATREGWLITTQNPMYDGVMFGIAFHNGQAFVRRDLEVPYFTVEPQSDEALDKMLAAQYPITQNTLDPEMVKAHRKQAKAHQREQEKLTSAERAVREFQGNHGFKVEFFDIERLNELDRILSDRVRQRNEAEAAEKARMQAENIIPPRFMGEAA